MSLRPVNITIGRVSFTFACHHPGHRRAVKCRFSGAYFTDPRTGEIIVASQNVPASTAVTGKLEFLDASGAPIAGPVGVISVDSPQVTDARLSSDGQSYNFTSQASGDVTLTWSDPAGIVPPASQTFSAEAAPSAVSVSFGPASPGTTA